MSKVKLRGFVGGAPPPNFLTFLLPYLSILTWDHALGGRCPTHGRGLAPRSSLGIMLLVGDAQPMATASNSYGRASADSADGLAGPSQAGGHVVRTGRISSLNSEPVEVVCHRIVVVRVFFKSWCKIGLSLTNRVELTASRYDGQKRFLAVGFVDCR